MIGFVLIPMYTNPENMPEALFGRLGLMETTLLFLTTVLSFGISYGIQVWYYEPHLQQKKGGLIFTSAAFLVLANLPMMGIAWIFQSQLGEILTLDGRQTRLILIFFACLIPEVLMQFLMIILRLAEAPTLFVAANILKLLVHLSLTIYFVAGLKMQLEGIYLAQLASYLPLFILIAPFVIARMKLSWEWTALKGMIRFSIPFIYGSVASNFATMGVMYLLRAWTSEVELGIFNLGQRIANITRVLVVNSLELSLTPAMMKMEESEETRKTYAKFLLHFSLLVMVSVLIFSLSGKTIISLANKGPQLMKAISAIPFFSFALFMEFVRNQSLIGTMRAKRSRFTGRGLLLWSALSIAFSAGLIPLFRYNGIPLAFSLAHFFTFLYFLQKSQRYYFIPYNYLKLIELGIMLIVFLGLGMMIDAYIHSLYLSVTLKGGIILALAALIWILGFFNENEVQFLKDVVKRFTGKS